MAIAAAFAVVQFGKFGEELSPICGSGGLWELKLAPASRMTIEIHINRHKYKQLKWMQSVCVVVVYAIDKHLILIIQLKYFMAKGGQWLQLSFSSSSLCLSGSK